MRLDFFLKLTYQSSMIILFVGINILCVTYFLLFTWPAKYRKWCQLSIFAHFTFESDEKCSLIDPF